MNQIKEPEEANPFINSDDLNFSLEEDFIFVLKKGDKTWWMRKMLNFCELARETFPKIDPLCAIMDEDDGFENRYLEKAVHAINHHKCKAVWSYTNMLVNREGFRIKRHREPIGTLVGHLSAFERVSEIAKKRYPSLTNGPNHPLDAKWRAIMEELYHPKPHAGLRYFIQWSGSSTRRDRKLEVDYND